MTSYKAAATVCGLLLVGSQALAADVEKTSLPAVSGPNGKIEASFGFVDLDDVKADESFRGGMSFSLPLGESFGFQGDVAAVDALNDTMIGGTAHFFMRDPNSHLLGIAGGAGFADDANVYFIGPEAELYMDSVSIEAWAGYMNVDFDRGGSKNKAFGFLDAAFYATEDLRFAVGASSVAGFESGHVSMEWQLSGLGAPVSLTADGELGENGYNAASVGLKLYFGGEDKSLIRRHREDDPRNRALDIFSSAGDAFTAAPTPAASTPPPPDFAECPFGEVDIDPGPGRDCRDDLSAT
jgi:hypothetical protein